MNPGSIQDLDRCIIMLKCRYYPCVLNGDIPSTYKKHYLYNTGNDNWLREVSDIYRKKLTDQFIEYCQENHQHMHRNVFEHLYTILADSLSEDQHMIVFTYMVKHDINPNTFLMHCISHNKPLLERAVHILGKRRYPIFQTFNWRLTKEELLLVYQVHLRFYYRLYDVYNVSKYRYQFENLEHRERLFCINMSLRQQLKNDPLFGEELLIRTINSFLR